MKCISSVFALCALAFLAACGSRRHTVQDYYAILPDLVRFAEADARKEAAGGKPAEGPLYIDANSFAGGGWQVTGQTLNRDSVMAAIKIPGARKVTPQEVLVIRDTGEVADAPEALGGAGGGRWVQEYGVFVRMNQTKWDPRELAATVTSYTTDRRTWPTGICRRIWRVTYGKQEDGSWKRTGAELRKACDDPDDV